MLQLVSIYMAIYIYIYVYIYVCVCVLHPIFAICNMYGYIHSDARDPDDRVTVRDVDICDIRIYMTKCTPVYQRNV